MPVTTEAPIRPTLRRRARAIRWFGLTAGLSVILVGLLLLFIMPTLKSGPRDLPLGVVAEGPTVDAIAAALEEHAPGGYLVEQLSSSAELDEAIRSKEVLGGLDLTRGGSARVAVASAGSTAISGTVAATGSAVAAQLGLAATVDDVVPLPDGDPIGAGIGGLAFPLVFGGIVPAVAFRKLLPGHRRLVLLGLLGFSLVGGFVVSTVLRYAFGSIDGSVWSVGAAIALGIAALAVPLAALNDALGAKGFTVAAMTMMFIGNPFAGIATSAVWLPAGVATLGQLLPPGAAGTLVRAVAYFDGAGGGWALLTLATWVALGLALYVAAPRVASRSMGTAG
ncbi:hypothetical protein ACX1DX_09160 [Tessaracoccus sp. Y36]